MSKNIQIECHMLMPHFRKDRCGTLKFTTARELTKEEREELLEAGVNDELGWLLWSPNKFQTGELPTEPAIDTGKTPAKRLRDVLFVLWVQEGKRGDFETYYKERMDKIIGMIKAKLDV
jgi:hypothetical protein